MRVRDDLPDGTVAICESCGELYTEETTLSDWCEVCELYGDDEAVFLNDWVETDAIVKALAHKSEWMQLAAHRGCAGLHTQVINKNGGRGAGIQAHDGRGEKSCQIGISR